MSLKSEIRRTEQRREKEEGEEEDEENWGEIPNLSDSFSISASTCLCWFFIYLSIYLFCVK